jgi:hypothetical protein
MGREARIPLPAEPVAQRQMVERYFDAFLLGGQGIPLHDVPSSRRGHRDARAHQGRRLASWT